MFQYKISQLEKSDGNINLLRYESKGQEQEHTHDFIEIVYIAAGSGQHFVNDICYNVERGDLLFINFNQTHSLYSFAGMTIVNCLLKPEFISQELIISENISEILALASFEDFGINALKLIPKVSFRGKDLIDVEAIIENMLCEFTEKTIGYKTALKGYLHVLLTKIFREMRKADIGQLLHQVNKITPEILKYIEEKCFEKITLKELAEKCFYNPSYFSRIFKECYGKNTWRCL